MRYQEAHQKEVEVYRKVRSEVRPQELTSSHADTRSLEVASRPRESACRRLLATYAALAVKGEHLMQPLLQGKLPEEWDHYPEDDAIDLVSGYQWFYHSHAPEVRPGATEHGHFHLFARRPCGQTASTPKPNESS